MAELARDEHQVAVGRVSRKKEAACLCCHRSARASCLSAVEKNQAGFSLSDSAEKHLKNKRNFLKKG